MSLVDRHATGMLSSVMRALKHMEAHALREQRPSSRSSAAAVGPAVRPVATQQASPTGHATDPEDGVSSRFCRRYQRVWSGVLNGELRGRRFKRNPRGSPCTPAAGRRKVAQAAVARCSTARALGSMQRRADARAEYQFTIRRRRRDLELQVGAGPSRSSSRTRGHTPIRSATSNLTADSVHITGCHGLHFALRSQRGNSLMEVSRKAVLVTLQTRCWPRAGGGSFEVRR
jgi:hypothetical protein